MEDNEDFKSWLQIVVARALYEKENPAEQFKLFNSSFSSLLPGSHVAQG